MSTARVAPGKDDVKKLLKLIDEAKPDVFAAVVAGKVDTGTVTATCFNLVDSDSQRLAVLGTTDDGGPGLALFRPGAERARAEIMLKPAGPEIRLNNVRGLARLILTVRDDDERPSVVLYGKRGQLRLTILLDEDRPHIIVFPKAGSRRHDVEAMPFGKKKTPRAWSRASRAAEAGNRKAFDRAARDCGFLTPDLQGLWEMAQRTIGATTTPEDTLRDAGITDARQARYQRKMSGALAGRGLGKDGA